MNQCILRLTSSKWPIFFLTHIHNSPQITVPTYYNDLLKFFFHSFDFEVGCYQSSLKVLDMVITYWFFNNFTLIFFLCFPPPYNAPCSRRSEGRIDFRFWFYIAYLQQIYCRNAQSVFSLMYANVKFGKYLLWKLLFTLIILCIDFSLRLLTILAFLSYQNNLQSYLTSIQ